MKRASTALALAAMLLGARAPQELAVTHRQNTDTVPLCAVFEITLTHEKAYDDPFFDVSIDVTFTSPSGRAIAIGGFHYGSTEKPKIRLHDAGRGGKQAEYIFEKRNLWKARFAPMELGAWTYQYTFANKAGEKATGKGAFTCVKGRARNPGFVRPHPSNPHRWVFDDGTPYYPVGLQDGVFDGSHVGSALAEWAMEGPFRTDRKGRPNPPAGALYKPGPSSNPQNADVYFRTFGQCGFNLLRFSQKNFSLDLYRDLDHWHVQEPIMVDELLACARKYGFRIMYGLFGYQPVFNKRADDAAGMAKVKRFVKYSVDRWGVYADFWQFLNEQDADDAWYAAMVPYLRSIDPYRHPITTSWERPRLDGIEINAPHWYQREDELRSDEETARRAIDWKKHGKPVIVGEQGNAIDRKKEPPEIGGVWDARSARRMRIRLWTAFFHEIAFVFWNTSYAKDGHTMNIWLGPKEREYVRALQGFAYCLDKDARMVPVGVSDPRAARAYGLASGERAGVYLQHFADHEKPVSGLKVTIDVPKAAKGYWYSTENAAILSTIDVRAGKQDIAVPDFTVDVALLITRDGAPDIDHDGKPNDVDPDNDNDGVPNEKDAFPLDPSEWEDKDGDMIGDNLDADDDGDGVGDDLNKNGTPDGDEMDFDGDGVPRARAVPWDAFPLDAKEWCDTDGDGIGDNADPDDDGDGWTDEEEKKAGTDPLDPLSFPKE